MSEYMVFFLVFNREVGEDIGQSEEQVLRGTVRVQG